MEHLKVVAKQFLDGDCSGVVFAEAIGHFLDDASEEEYWALVRIILQAALHKE